MSEQGEVDPEVNPDDRLAENEIDDAVPSGGDSLPPPETLAQYEAVLPGLAERVVDDWERSRAHRRNQEAHQIANELMALETRRRVARWDFLVRIWSLGISAIIVIGGLIAGIVLTLIFGWSSASLASFLVALAGLGAVIYGNSRRGAPDPPEG